MKKVILVLLVALGFMFSVVSCDDTDYCDYEVYQGGVQIDFECKICGLGDHEGEVVYFIETAAKCNP